MKHILSSILFLLFTFQTNALSLAPLDTATIYRQEKIRILDSTQSKDSKNEKFNYTSTIVAGIFFIIALILGTIGVSKEYDGIGYLNSELILAIVSMLFASLLGFASLISLIMYKRKK